MAAPANQTCATAAVIASLPFEVDVDATDAIDEPVSPEPSCGTPAEIYKPIWYSFTPNFTGSVLMTTKGGDNGAGVAVYTGACGALVEADCSFDFESRPFGRLIVAVTSGTPYKILVWTREAADPTQYHLLVRNVSAPGALAYLTGHVGGTKVVGFDASGNWLWTSDDLTDIVGAVRVVDGYAYVAMVLADTVCVVDIADGSLVQTLSIAGPGAPTRGWSIQVVRPTSARAIPMCLWSNEGYDNASPPNGPIAAGEITRYPASTESQAAIASDQYIQFMGNGRTYSPTAAIGQRLYYVRVQGTSPSDPTTWEIRAWDLDLDADAGSVYDLLSQYAGGFSALFMVNDRDGRLVLGLSDFATDDKLLVLTTAGDLVHEWTYPIGTVIGEMAAPTAGELISYVLPATSAPQVVRTSLIDGSELSRVTLDPIAMDLPIFDTVAEDGLPSFLAQSRGSFRGLSSRVNDRVN